MILFCANRPYCVKSEPIMWNHKDIWVKTPLKCLKKDPFSHEIQNVDMYPTCLTMKLPGYIDLDKQHEGFQRRSPVKIHVSLQERMPSTEQICVNIDIWNSSNIGSQIWLIFVPCRESEACNHKVWLILWSSKFWRLCPATHNRCMIQQLQEER